MVDFAAALLSQNHKTGRTREWVGIFTFESVPPGWDGSAGIGVSVRILRSEVVVGRNGSVTNCR